MWKGLLVAALVAGCGFQSVDGADDLAGGGAGDDLGGVDLSDVDLTLGGACAVLPLPCLDSALANVIEVPAESTAQSAFASAKQGDTIQINGLGLGSGFRVPPGVTLHGCGGAHIDGTLAFEGMLGVVEGFSVSGSIIANRTGTYQIRDNRFVAGGAAPSLAGVSARAAEGIVSAAVTATVERNWFEERPLGIEALTAYDTLTHSITLTARNNIFAGTMVAIALDEGGIVGKIDADIAFNTLNGSATAIRIHDVQATTPIRANIISNGGTGIDSDSPYTVANVYYFAMPIPIKSAQPLSGALVNADPQFVYWQLGDFHLKPESELVDKVPAASMVPPSDYAGCPRPVAKSGTANADPGALELQ